MSYERIAIDAALIDANKQSVAVYLRRQDVELQRQQLNAIAQQCEQELLRLDGEIRILTKLQQADGGQGGS